MKGTFLKPFFLLLFSFALWLCYTLVPANYNWIQTFLFSAGLLCIGIPHGALDYMLESGNIKGKIGVNYILRYVGTAGALFLFWLVAPKFSLFFFLLYSAFHFGQSDMQEWRLRFFSSLKSLIWGMMVLGIILCSHETETILVLKDMNVIIAPLQIVTGIEISILLIVSAIIWGVWEQRSAMVFCACMLAVGMKLPLISSFGLYFIGQHSLNGWSHLKQAMHANNAALFLKAIPFTFGAFLLFIAMMIYTEKVNTAVYFGHWVSVFFIFISCISFPHVIEMNAFYKKYYFRHSSFVKNKH